jgi:hypothetical protein
MMPAKCLRFWARALTIVAVLVSCAVASGRAAAAVTLANWDAAQQRQVVRAGLMSAPGNRFDGGVAITAVQANAAMAALAARLQGAGAAAGVALAPVATASNPVTVVIFDRMVVEQLGLGDVAAHVQAAAAAAGLLPPGYFGSEVVARYLGLRYTHPTGSEQLARYPSDPITRAEAA